MPEKFGWRIISVAGIARADTQTSYKAEVEAEHVEIEPRLTGSIKRVAVRDGQFVAKGDVLVELDDTQVRASFAAATANVSAKQAALAAAEAAATSDRSELAKANLDLARARVQQAQAVRDLAELEVGYTTIKAEISGLLALHTGGGVERFHAIGTITDVEHAWVTASFTEPQVATIKPGQVADGFGPVCVVMRGHEIGQFVREFVGHADRDPFHAA